MIVGVDERHPMNTFAWTKAMLELGSKSASAQVARVEADQKFFRSVCLVTALVAIHSFFSGYIDVGLGAALATIAFFMRYVERRQKAITSAYQYVIVMTHLAVEGAEKSAPPDANAAALGASATRDAARGIAAPDSAVDQDTPRCKPDATSPG
jgi:hypothetical protein